MKASIVMTFQHSAKILNADTGTVIPNVFETERPIRVVEPSEALAPFSEEDLVPLRRVLRKNYSSAQVEELTQLLGTPNDTITDLMLRKGDEHILNYYANRLTDERIAAWDKRDSARRASLGNWVYRGTLVRVEGWESGSYDEIVTVVIHEVLRHEDFHGKLKREIDLMQRAEELMKPSVRAPIPKDVQIAVWRRDGGKCVTCGSNELIEFDHIIPLSKGGSNTFRNIQILCERCNRAKGDSI